MMTHLCFQLLIFFYILEFIYCAYDFVFGYSTGHVGTTFLSSKHLYDHHANHIFFLFEKHHVDTLVWKKWTYKNEYEYVNKTLIPELIEWKRKNNKKTIFDLGHCNLYYFDAFLDIAMKTNYNFTIVRLRRPRYETALSLMHSSNIRKGEHIQTFHTNMCASWVRYCPYEREEDVILKVSKYTWDRWALFQQALWLIDEVEARWDRALKRHPNMNRIEIFWTKEIPNTMQHALEQMASILETDWIKDQKKQEDVHKLKIHASMNSSLIEPEILHHYEKLDKEYKAAISQ